MKILYSIFILILISYVQVFPQSKYVLKCRNNILKISELISLAEVGTIEKGRTNSGDAGKYLKCVGLKKGEPYCAAGQYYCFAEAVKFLHLTVLSIPIKRTGNANLMFEDAIHRGIKSRYVINEHDLIVWRKGKSRSGHIERVIIPGKAGWATTVGFNVRKYDNLSKKYVEGVFLMRRNIYEPLQRMRVRGIIGFAVIKGRN
ncbi:MAG: hypothetical protein A2X61_13630 [Ignavibacteria bacterium GWB2_35_12]|nr:MAG: hypothetical protein A2X61_13630 [Ignavibacteria bacterium GWB2_35_12]OGU95200.1 MAG: hypothetical protein A2220_00280 [Ignavibacteria bacterium RIFOXYA2_FULL_35_10]OGV24508.1 MAG: hypothetical protein A2475_15495 [Ignavibacteria bacterium RIFOXYC2_FULL_35_21]